jgi:hypothetical protein
MGPLLAWVRIFANFYWTQIDEERARNEGRTEKYMLAHVLEPSNLVIPNPL